MTGARIKKLVMTALFTALCCVATMIIRVPSPTGGYINPGDAVVLLGACFLGPVCGAVAGGIGSAMADILSGYVIYAPATLIIKALMALCAGLIIQRMKGVLSVIISGIAAEIIMISGYFLFSAQFLGLGWGALPEIPGNCVQGVFGVTVSTLLYSALSRIPYMKNP